MPIAIGLLSSQQESFEHHEELSKLSNESEVFYVPFQNDFHNNQDLSNLTKRFDEDISNRHLVVTFRDIGYSLFLGSVRSIPDQNDQTKTRISGKMIVDGICIQFLGRFDCHHKNGENQQINGIGKVQLDEDYYRELSSTQIYKEESMDSMDYFDSISEMDRSMPKTKARSRTISENILGKNRNNLLKSPPSSLSNSRSRLHSPSHFPYTIRSPRTMINVNRHQHQASSPINIESSSVSRSSGFHSSFISPSSSVPSSFNENPIDLSQTHHQSINSVLLSSSLRTPSTMPIEIPSSNSLLPPASLPHPLGIFPVTQSHSLPNYFLPRTNLTYLLTSSNPPHSLHFLTSLHSQAKQQYASTYLSTITNNQTNTIHDSLTKQIDEQLPLKKRRYNGDQQSSSVCSPMDVNQDDDDASNESLKK